MRTTRVRGEEDRQAAQEGRRGRHPLARDEPHARDEHTTLLPASLALQTIQALEEVPLPAQRQEDPLPQPGVVDGHHLRPDRWPPHVPHRRDRLAQPLHRGLEAVGLDDS